MNGSLARKGVVAGATAVALALAVGGGCTPVTEQKDRFLPAKAAFPPEQKQPVGGTIVCFGDSLTVCGGPGGTYPDWLAHWLPNVDVINRGIGGDTLAGGRMRFKRDVLDEHPDVVVIALGANDFWRRERPIQQLQDDLDDMVCQARVAGIEVVIASCFGRRDLPAEDNVEFEIGRMEQDVCRRNDCFYVPNMQIDIKPNGRVPYWADTNHPNKAGNELVARRILGQLEHALARVAQQSPRR